MREFKSKFKYELSGGTLNWRQQFEIPRSNLSEQTPCIGWPTVHIANVEDQKRLISKWPFCKSLTIHHSDKTKTVPDTVQYLAINATFGVLLSLDGSLSNFYSPSSFLILITKGKQRQSIYSILVSAHPTLFGKVKKIS